MSIYGDMSKAQRKLLAALYSEISGQRAVSAETALMVDRKGRQTAANLEAAGYVRTSPRQWSWSLNVWLTDAGVQLMKSLDLSKRNYRVPSQARSRLFGTRG